MNLMQRQMVGLAAVVTVAATLTGAAHVAGRPRPVDNDCSGGHVAFTFDDGPGPATPAVLDRLDELNLKGTFFLVASKLEDEDAAATARDIVRRGSKVENHTFDHRSWTGASTGAEALSPAQVRTQLQRASEAMVAAGLPRPTLYRPPYGDVSAGDDAVARSLGLRVVMPFGVEGANVVDSRDWSGLSSEQIAQAVTDGTTVGDEWFSGVRADSIVTFHDGTVSSASRSMEALQDIVDVMNDKHLCSTTTIRSDATGGVVPAPAPRPPSGGGLVRNAALSPDGASRTDLVPCFQGAGTRLAGTTADWRVREVAPGDGTVALSVASRRFGDRKLVQSLDPDQSRCVLRPAEGRRFGLWMRYRGSWQSTGDSAAQVRLVVLVREHGGRWRYWTEGPEIAPSKVWTWTYLATPPVPAGAEAASFGFVLSGRGEVDVEGFAARHLRVGR